MCIRDSCHVGNPQRVKADLIVDQADVEFVKKGDSVKIRMEAYTSKTFEGSIDEISRDRLRHAPRVLSNQAGGDLATQPDAEGREVPMNTSFPASVHLDNSDGLLQIGFRGKAKIRAGHQTLAGRLWRCLLYTSPSPRDATLSRMPSSA